MGRIQKAILAIITERQKLGKLSQKQISRALGCGQASISQMLTGARGLSETKIEEFCDFLKITLGDIENPTPIPIEPKPLRDSLKKLRRLYEDSSVPGFKNVTRSMESPKSLPQQKHQLLHQML
jgi:transcriptional regulator with XRE-family HTH domain